MLTRRGFFAGLAALPLLRFLEPLARWLRPAPIVANTRRAAFIGAQASELAFGPPPGNHVRHLIFDDVETESRNYVRRVSVENGPVLWEEVIA